MLSTCCHYITGRVVSQSSTESLSAGSVPAQPYEKEGEESWLAEQSLTRSSTEEAAVCLPADVKGEAVDVTVPALSPQHPYHRQLLVVGVVGIAGVLRPGRHVGDEVLGVVPPPLRDTLVAATLSQPSMTGSPGHVSPVMLATPQLDGVGQPALTTGL